MVYELTLQTGPSYSKALNPGLNNLFNPGLLFLCSKAFSRIIFCVILRASNHQPVDKRIKTEMLFKLSNLNSNLALTLGYLNPALNNSALSTKVCLCVLIVVVGVAFRWVASSKVC